VPQLNNPQSLNRYTYALNNPLGLVDPDGKNPIDPQLLYRVQHFNDWAGPIADANARRMISECSSGGSGCGNLSKQDRLDATQRNYDWLRDEQMKMLSDQVDQQVLAWANQSTTTADEVYAAAGRIKGSQNDQNATRNKVKDAAGNVGSFGKFIPEIGEAVGTIGDIVDKAMGTFTDSYQDYLQNVATSQLNAIGKSKDEAEKKKQSCQANSGGGGCDGK
jgi:hypothetical protein